MDQIMIGLLTEIERLANVLDINNAQEILEYLEENKDTREGLLEFTNTLMTYGIILIELFGDTNAYNEDNGTSLASSN